MNRANIVQAIAACDALGAELRRQLKADAAAEYAEQGTAPTWRLPGFTVSTSITHPTVEVVDEPAFRRWVEVEYPTEIETIKRVRPAWQAAFLAEVTRRGDPPCDAGGIVLPGLRYVPGGEFRSVSVLPSADTKSVLRTMAQEIAAGRRPLALPSTEADR